jgi:hypothetical protein
MTPPLRPARTRPTRGALHLAEHRLDVPERARNPDESKPRHLQHWRLVRTSRSLPAGHLSSPPANLAGTALESARRTRVFREARRVPGPTELPIGTQRYASRVGRPLRCLRADARRPCPTVEPVQHTLSRSVNGAPLVGESLRRNSRRTARTFWRSEYNQLSSNGRVLAGADRGVARADADAT